MKGARAESTRGAPAIRHSDVVVAGGGVSGVFAALGAARMGASVLLVERFGSLGGNMGSQGLMVAGGSGLASQRLSAKAKRFVPSRAVPPSGLMEEFFSRAQRLLPRAETTLPEIANAYSCVAADMARDSGVTLMLSCYAGDPLMDGDRVEGLYVETKSGRVAVRGKVVVDATGNADVAFRAGAPMCLGQSAESVQSPGMNPWTLRPRYRTWDDGGLAYLIGGVDMGRYLAWYRRPVTLSAEDAAWRTERLAEAMSGFQWWKDSVIPLFRLSAEQGGFAPLREIGPRTYTQFDLAFEEIAPGLVKGCASVFGELDAGAWEQVSLAESELRRHILEGVVFLRQHVPGFEKATLVTVAPFLGTRGGRRIEAEVTLTPRQMWEGVRCPDVMFVSFCETPRGAASRGHDAPYGMLVPQRVDGLLVTGRGAGWARRGHDPAFRSRTQMMRFGQAAGVAAALSARQGAPPRGLDVKELQRRLLAEGFYLGDEARLNELGLAAPSRDAGGESLAGAVCAAGDPLPQTQREDALCP